MSETIATLTEKMNTLMATMKADGARLLGEFFKEKLAAAPDIKAIRWRQYTPYFNDGDPCTFSVHEPQFQLADGVEHGAGFYEYAAPWYEVSSRAESDIAKACLAIQSEMQSAPDEIYEAAFGDHMEITVTRDGEGVTVEVDEYEHD